MSFPRVLSLPPPDCTSKIGLDLGREFYARLVLVMTSDDCLLYESKISDYFFN